MRCVAFYCDMTYPREQMKLLQKTAIIHNFAYFACAYGNMAY